MTISDLVRTYLKNKPYTLEALDNGITNYSALARLLQKELGIKNYQAIKGAIRRYAMQREHANEGIEERAVRVLRHNEITLLSGVNVIISNKEINVQHDAKVKVDAYHVYLTRKNVMSEMKKKDKDSIVKSHQDCSALIIYSGAKVENVSGVVAFILTLLAEQNINVIELISVYTETILVVDKLDALRSYEILSGIMK